MQVLFVLAYKVHKFSLVFSLIQLFELFHNQITRCQSYKYRKSFNKLEIRWFMTRLYQH